jgi:hypothetical protein
MVRALLGPDGWPGAVLVAGLRTAMVTLNLPAAARTTVATASDPSGSAEGFAIRGRGGCEDAVADDWMTRRATATFPADGTGTIGSTTPRAWAGAPAQQRRSTTMATALIVWPRTLLTLAQPAGRSKGLQSRVSPQAIDTLRRHLA